MAATLGWRIFLRSLLVQSSWNFSGMQNLGYFFMTWPALSRRGLSAPELREAGLRHLRQFNTHPYLAGLVAATVVRSEQYGQTEEGTEELKRSLMCALGAVGDEFFWATLRPFAAIVALPAAIAGFAWAPLILLAVFNVPHLTVRLWGIRVGLARGSGIVEMLQRRPFSRALPALGTATTALIGFLVGSGASDRFWGLIPGHGLLSAAAAAAVFALLLTLQFRGLGQGRLLAYLSAVTAVAGAVFVMRAP